MNENNSIWRFCLSALAVWRLTHLLTEEDGPWDMIARLRVRLGSSMAGRLIDCFYCVSLWIALPLAVFTSSGWLGLTVHWLALSGAASLLEKVTSRPSQDFPRIEPLEGDAICAVAKIEAY
jgi:hypothetical protein